MYRLAGNGWQTRQNLSTFRHGRANSIASVWSGLSSHIIRESKAYAAPAGPMNFSG
jgi:hypothetical protein